MHSKDKLGILQNKSDSITMIFSWTHPVEKWGLGTKLVSDVLSK